MNIYFLVLLLLFILSLFNLYEKDVNKTFLNGSFLYLVLTLFVGTRLMGPDIDSYVGFYTQIPSIGEYLSSPLSYVYLSIDPLYMMFNAIVRDFYGFSFESFLLLFSAIFVFLAFLGIKNYSPYPIVSLLVYFYYGYFSGFSVIRQVMAAAIFFYAIKFVIERNITKYLLSMFIILLLHSTSIILIPLYFLLNKNYTNKIILIVISVLTILASLNLFSFLTNIITSVFSSIPILSFVADKVQMYSDSGDVSAFGGTITLEWLILILAIIVYKKELFNNFGRIFLVFFNLLWIGFVCFAIFSSLGDFARIVIYFKMTYLILIPMLLTIMTPKRKVVFLCVIALAVGLRVYASIMGDAINNDGVSRYIPYSTWLIK